eukprot:304053-Pleurochrysis_carterae.AAC.2
MARSFAKLWRHCPANTRLFPGHEYTLAILPQVSPTFQSLCSRTHGVGTGFRRGSGRRVAQFLCVPLMCALLRRCPDSGLGCLAVCCGPEQVQLGRGMSSLCRSDKSAASASGAMRLPCVALNSRF